MMMMMMMMMMIIIIIRRNCICTSVIVRTRPAFRSKTGYTKLLN